MQIVLSSTEVINKFFEWILNCITAYQTGLFVSIMLVILTKILERIKGVNKTLINLF